MPIYQQFLNGKIGVSMLELKLEGAELQIYKSGINIDKKSLYLWLSDFSQFGHLGNPFFVFASDLVPVHPQKQKISFSSIPTK